MILNWVKYNFINNNPLINCINKELKSIKHKPFLNAFYDICIKNTLPVDQIFKDIVLAKEVTVFNFKVNSKPIGPNYDLNPRPISPTLKEKLWLGEEEEKEEKKEEEEQQQQEKEVSTKEIIESAEENLKQEQRIRKVVDVFNNNMHPITPMEYEKILYWAYDVEPEVIILAIEESINHNARNFAYVERVLNTWHDLGFRTIQAVKTYNMDFKKYKRDSLNRLKDSLLY